MKPLEMGKNPQSGRGFKRKLLGDQTREELLSTHTQCQYFMEQKRRFCGVARTPDSLYCGNHEAFCSDSSLKPARKRIPCPVDPSHSIYADCANKHVKICNITTERRAMESEPYYCLNCNSGAPSDADTDAGRSVVDADGLLSKINSFYSSLGPLVAVEPRDVDTPVSDELRLIEETVVKAVAPAQSSFKQLRHAQQDAKIVYEMLKHKLLPASNCDGLSSTNTVYVELGAGRGVLGQAVSSVSSESSLVLVERSGQRRKADTQLRRVPGGQFTRIRMDIRHCRLAGLRPFLEHERGPKRVVVIAKHLCGVATDLALRSLETLPESVASRGLSIATCCHHACMWDDYVGKDWLVSSGFSRSEFNVLRLWSSWAFALGSTRVSDGIDTQEQDQDQDQDQDQEKEHQAPTLPQSVARPSGMTREAMAECGFKIKRLLDYGRLRYAREKLGLSTCRVVQYCNHSESPECYLLVG